MNTGKIFWGLLLIVIGSLFFLNNFGLVNWATLRSLLRFWPVLLIIWGLLALTGKSPGSPWLIILVIIIIGGLAGGSYFWTSYEYNVGSVPFIRGEQNIQIGPNMESASLKLDYGAGTLDIGVNPGGMLGFSYLDYAEPVVDTKASGSRAEYHIKQPSGHFPITFPNKGGRRWRFSLPGNVAWDIDIDLGAAKSDLDFRDIDLKSLDLDMGAGDVIIRLGERGLETTLDIDAGASNIKVIVPDTMELKVKIEGGLNNTNLTSAGLVKEGNYYITEGISSSSKLNLKFSGGVSNFELIRQSHGKSFASPVNTKNML